MKHVEKIEFEGDDGVYGYRAGFCNELNGYVLRTMSGWVYDYCVYYRITKEEYRKVMENLDGLNNGTVYPEEIIPGIHDRFVGAGFKRAYEINPHFPKGCDPYTYMDAPYLLNDGTFYFHLYYDGRHYAAVPRRMSVNEGERVYPLRKMPGVKKHVIEYDGKEVFLCWGIMITDFEGMDEWKKFHEGR